MRMHFNDVEGHVLHGLIEDASDDIVVRLDSAGFIVHASVNAMELGIDFHALLLMPHISDLADPEFAPDLVAHVTKVLDGEREGGWIEFPLIERGEDAPEDGDSDERRRRWYAFSLRAIKQDDGTSQGALGLLRSVQSRHDLEHELGRSATTDAQTGLANRQAFCGALARAIGRQDQQSMAIFAVDRMRAIFMQYGQATTDEIRWGFAKFLETMTHPDQELAQLDEERFAVILPGMGMRAARDWASDVLQTFAGLTSSPSRTPELTASAGLARVEMSVDWTLRQAELGLVMARAGGGMQAAVCQPTSRIACGSLVERAMEAAVQRAEQRRA